MANTLIDTKTEIHTFGVWPLKETVTTTIQLYKLEIGGFGASYSVLYSGVKDGDVAGGPIPIQGNMIQEISPDPSVKVKVTVSEYLDSRTTVSMHITAEVTVSEYGTKMIFNQTLGGATPSI